MQIGFLNISTFTLNSFLLKKEMEDLCIILFAINLEGPFFVIGIFLITVTWGFGFPSLVIDIFNSLDCKRMLMITSKTWKIILDCILLKPVHFELALARSPHGRLNVI